MLSFYLQRGIIWIVLMVGMEGRSNREKLRKEAGATVLSRKRGAHGFGWRLRGLRDVGLG